MEDREDLDVEELRERIAENAELLAKLIRLDEVSPVPPSVFLDLVGQVASDFGDLLQLREREGD